MGARERAGEAEAISQLGGLNLLTLGAVVTIVASLGSLATTGIGTIWSARVAADQLAQSREQDDARKRAQASRISIWTEVDDSGERRLHLANRSVDPVARVEVFLSIYPPGGRTLDSVTFPVLMGSLPPCTDSVISAKTLRWDPQASKEEEFTWREVDPSKERWGEQVKGGWGWVTAMSFSDRDGQEWTRNRGELKNAPDFTAYSAESLLSDVLHAPAEEGRGPFGRVTSLPEVQALKSCGDDTAN
ncbi:hypothetical protein ACIA8E_36920 [Streptomyces sp. NPDC051664]|uniref:hypothetical protein n=1 Tax=Streptomyces sp. NPDC051664 TaxID=3365668 RepID=UPI003792AF3B